MNAIIALCHFCESHGPVSVFCTQTVHKSITKLVNVTLENQSCNACTSIGISSAIVSKDNLSNIKFISTQKVTTNLTNLIREAAIRSLSSEITNSNRETMVFFNNSIYGHVLSHRFYVSDNEARGFKRLFSIIIVMKDKFFLLNLYPFLSKHIQAISSKIQIYSQKNSTSNIRNYEISTLSLRSLIKLTGQNDIFKTIHENFSWILSNGAKITFECASFENLPWLKTFSKDKQVIKIKHNSPRQELSEISIRDIEKIFKSDFEEICYCTIIGAQISLQDENNKTSYLIECLRILLPNEMHPLLNVDRFEYISNQNLNDVGLKSIINNGLPTYDWNDIKILKNNSTRRPRFLSQVINACKNCLFTDFVLNQRIQILVQEWKNKIKCLKYASNETDVTKLMTVLEIQSQDKPLVDYWIKYL